MMLNELRPNAGATHSKKRVGRGMSSGHGKTSTRGHKGQKSRSGYSRKKGFEGGQISLFKRLPKRGFNNTAFATVYSVINLEDLNVFEENTIVTPTLLKEYGIVKQELDGLKVLGQGNLEKKLTVVANKFSQSAVTKIEAVGGKIEVI